MEGAFRADLYTFVLEQQLSAHHSFSATFSLFIISVIQSLVIYLSQGRFCRYLNGRYF